jgi:hypothetical protein
MNRNGSYSRCPEFLSVVVLCFALSQPFARAQSFTVQFTASPTNGYAPLAVQFNSTNVDSQGNAITNWNWNFGDGAASHDENPSHIYANFGTFNPGLIATNNQNVAVTGCGPQIVIPTPTSPTNFIYTTNSSSAITINQYIGTNTAVIIPATIGGVPVSIINQLAFANCANLASVVIPTNVTSIGGEAFLSCTSLASVVIPNNVINIGDLAFFNCTSLTNITIGSSVASISSDVLSGCSALETINVVANNPAYRSVGGVLFNKNLTSLVECPLGLTGNYAIPDGVTGVVFGAFSDCASLTGVMIPATITNIGQTPFAGCTSLTSIVVDSNNPAYSSALGVLFNKSQTTLLAYPGGLGGFYAIPQGVTGIGNSAFLFCAGLTGVTIPAGVTNIGDSAFSDCTGLTNVTIPNSVASIGDSAFEICSSLANLTIGNGVTLIGNNAFSSCSALIQVTIPDSVIAFGDDAFYNCTALTNATVGSGISVLSMSVFFGCTNLTAINIDPNNPSLSSIGGVVFDKSQTTLMECPVGFSGNYAIPNGVTSIGVDAFFYCANLTTVTIPASVTNIEDYAFGNCTSLIQAYCAGKPPAAGYGIFPGSAGTVYYLPGMPGWGSAFGGWSTALLYQSGPPVLSSGSGVGVRSGGFGFNISWASNLSMVVEACTNLTNPNWMPIATNTLAAGTNYFNDPAWTNSPGRFYRVRTQ